MGPWAGIPRVHGQGSGGHRQWKWRKPSSQIFKIKKRLLHSEYIYFPTFYDSTTAACTSLHVTWRRRGPMFWVICGPGLGTFLCVWKKSSPPPQHFREPNSKSVMLQTCGHFQGSTHRALFLPLLHLSPVGVPTSHFPAGYFVEKNLDLDLTIWMSNSVVRIFSWKFLAYGQSQSLSSGFNIFRQSSTSFSTVRIKSDIWWNPGRVVWAPRRGFTTLPKCPPVPPLSVERALLAITSIFVTCLPSHFQARLVSLNPSYGEIPELLLSLSQGLGGQSVSSLSQSPPLLDDCRHQSVLQWCEGNAWFQPWMVLEDLLGSHQSSVSPGELSSPFSSGPREKIHPHSLTTIPRKLTTLLASVTLFHHFPAPW